MSKESGLGANLYVDGVDFSNDVQQVKKISKSIVPILQTGIDKSALERKAGKLDGSIAWVNYLNPTNSHPTISTLTRNDRIVSYLHRPTLAVPACAIVCKQMDYGGKREESGQLLFDVEALANQWWLDWGLACTAGKRIDGAPANGTGVDFNQWGAPNNFGLQAYLHVFAFTGTNVTVKLQGSSDNAVGDPYADITGGAFAAVTAAPAKERIQTARNQAIERWVRVVTTGTFTSVTFAVIVTVNATDMSLV